MKIKKIYFLSFIFFMFLLLLTTKSLAGSQEWNNLNYDVTVNDDGSMKVVETWDIDISYTNTLFKDFNLDPNKFSEITDVSVMEVKPTEQVLEKIDEEQYHVDPGCFYALPIKGNKFEIAWNVGLDNSSGTRTYRISYTVKDVVKVYSDCTELYWMFVDSTNAIGADKVTGTVTLPKSVSDLEKLRVWGHGPLYANIEKVSKNKVKFDCIDFPSETMFEIRIVTDENIYSYCNNYINENKLSDILAEETKWANEANAARNRAKMILYASYIVCGIVVVFAIKKYMDYSNAGKELEIQFARSIPDYKYFRDIPDEKHATPARAAYIRYFTNSSSNIDIYIPRIFSATMLDLALKKYIEFEPIDSKNFTVILKELSGEQLADDELTCFEILRKAAKGTNKVTTKELLKYTKQHYESLHYQFERITKQAKSYCENEKHIIDAARKVKNAEWSSRAGKYFGIFVFMIAVLLMTLPFLMELVGFGALWLAICIGVASIILGIKCINVSKKVSVLSDNGEEERLQWKGLEKYMKEFSLLKEKEVPDLVLWEKFLVYATAFGISKEVIEQLKVVYPEMSNPDYYRNKDYAYMYYMSNSSFGDNFIKTFNNAMTKAISSSQSAYNTAHSSSSSGSGGGGGFSGGGGGRTEVAAAVAVVNE